MSSGGKYLHAIDQLTSFSDFEEVLKRPVAILFKHSPACGNSARAYKEVESFIRMHPESPVFLVDVLSDRELSQQIARHFDIRHESPQIFILTEGKPIWCDSHFGIRMNEIERQLPTK